MHYFPDTHAINRVPTPHTKGHITKNNPANGRKRQVVWLKTISIMEITWISCGDTSRMRQWIGIDITHPAIVLIKKRLLDAFGEKVTQTYEVQGEPTSLQDARALADQDKFQFQSWALGLVGARLAEQKKGPDQGIDGRLYIFDDREGGKEKQVILSVKGGHTSVKDIRDLRGVIERENAEIGVLITLQEPTQPMRAEAANAGFYNSPWGGTHPRLQVLTIAELLAGKRIDMPPSRQVNVTFKKAPRIREEQPDLLHLPMG